MPIIFSLFFTWTYTSEKLFLFQAIGNRLEEMLTEDKKHLETVAGLVTDAEGQRELLQQDEEEDFLDEGARYC
jgi:hypothetical protein